MNSSSSPSILAAGPLKRFGDRLVREISQPYELEGALMATIGASVGIARAPDDGHDLATLMAAADAALYEAKSQGKARCVMAPTRPRAPALADAAAVAPHHKDTPSQAA